MQALSNGKTFTLSEGIVATLKKGLAFVFLTQEYIRGRQLLGKSQNLKTAKVN